ncbi:YggS family pyridoxal phosphate-dependent enzyme [Niallia sp. 03133]|uniref:YggS family pyridoxal phosphate-dependent enzyme n=1 Tax=Niallia sp. 03133 TaxID=3458060 RepID=UPI00404458F6
MLVKDNFEKIEKNIEEACVKVNRPKNDITLIAVTKYVTIERAQEALEAGVRHLGENREDGLLAKFEILKDKPVWHFIGSLQTRKVKSIIDYVDYIHSLDRLSLAKEIHKRADRTIKCLVQVNTSQEETKHGLAPEETINFIKNLAEYTNIQIVGLMTMAPFTDDEAQLRSCFQTLKRLQTEIQAMHLDYAPCIELSMGMSNDYSIAIEEGATMIRIGTALVGNEK